MHFARTTIALACALAVAGPAQATHVPSSAKPCQMYQVRWESRWSPPRSKARVRQTPHHRRVRFVPLDSRYAYKTFHGPRLTRCLTQQQFRSVSTSKALSVFECESGFYPLARNGSYLGVPQQTEGLFYEASRATRLSKADKQASMADVFNSYAAIYTALWRVQHEGSWSRWECA